jgi:broad specificity phosphatase PhoE
MGQADPPCEAIVGDAAASLGKRLMSGGISHLFSSPLQRCLATTYALFPEREPERDHNLRERHLGEWSGKPKTLVQCEQPLAFFSNGAMDPRVTPPFGESFAELCQRVMAVLATYGALPSGSRVVAVSHNGIIRCVRYIIEDLTIEEAFAVGEPHLTPRVYELRGEQLESALNRVRQAKVTAAAH